MNGVGALIQTRRGFIGGVVGAAASAALWARGDAASSAGQEFDPGPVRHAHFQLDARDCAESYPVHVLGPVAAMAYARLAAYSQLRRKSTHVVGTTLQHDAEPGRHAMHLVLSARFSDGSTATFEVSPHRAESFASTIHFRDATIVAEPDGFRCTHFNGKTTICSARHVESALA